MYNHQNWLLHKHQERVYPFIQAKDYLSGVEISKTLNIVYACLSDINQDFINRIQEDKNLVLMIDTWNKHGMAEQRSLLTQLMNNHCDVPVIIGRAYGNLSPEQLQLHSATDIWGHC